MYPPIICGVPPAHVLSPNEDDAKEELLPNNDVPSIDPLPKALDDVLPLANTLALVVLLGTDELLPNALAGLVLAVVNRAAGE